MKTLNDLFERIKTDEAFAQEFDKALQEKREAGAKSYYETIIPAAEERGYSVSKEDIDECIRAKETELSEEELGKIAGGSLCFSWIVGTISVAVAAGLSYYDYQDYKNRRRFEENE